MSIIILIIELAELNNIGVDYEKIRTILYSKGKRMVFNSINETN